MNISSLREAKEVRTVASARVRMRGHAVAQGNHSLVSQRHVLTVPPASNVMMSMNIHLPFVYIGHESIRIQDFGSDVILGPGVQRRGSWVLIMESGGGHLARGVVVAVTSLD